MNTANPYAPPQATVKDVADSDATPAGRGTRLVAVFLDGIIGMASCTAFFLRPRIRSSSVSSSRHSA
jgi:hypothetical protein